ncbi:Protoheme IX farnesyltransferase [Labeo rohita]|uniref:Protoheme IX farnesyltransferase n=1 Tax=Labeo rohita TaxID=84645 RepID=A0ABQ8LA96_LABRO|nr:Protoheme IX farnesyltransferase [Labeo rohita]
MSVFIKEEIALTGCFMLCLLHAITFYENMMIFWVIFIQKYRKV